MVEELGMDRQQRTAVLRRGLSGPWQSEPMLGSHYGEEEIEAAVRAIRTSLDPSVGFGFICEEIEQFERDFAAYCGTAHCISICTASCGLDMAMTSLDLAPEDEVICPSINFRAAPMSILGRGAKLVLCEVEPATLCADPEDVEQRITPRTRAILVTHMNGVSADMDALYEVAARHPHPVHGPPKVIGDAARACGGGHRGMKIGKAGWMTIFSFHTMKNMSTLGEGGAITTDDDGIVPRMIEMRQFGHEHWGSSYKMTKVQAAVGSVQLRRLDDLIARRRRLAAARTEMLTGIPELVLPAEPPGREHSYYMYTVMVSPQWAGEKRDALLRLLLEKYGVKCDVFNRPVHEVVPFIARHTQGQRLPVSEGLGKRLFCPPIHPMMSEQDNEYIAAALWAAVEEIGSGGRGEAMGDRVAADGSKQTDAVADGVRAMAPRERMTPSARKLRDVYAVTPGAPLFQKEFGYYCLEQWREQGMPQDVPWAELFGYDPPGDYGLGELGWCEAAFLPAFEERVVEDRGEYEVVQDCAGRHLLCFKGRRDGFMPEYLDHPVKDMKTWEEGVRWRLAPEAPGRFDGLEERMAAARAAAAEGKVMVQGLIGGYMYLRSLIGPIDLLYAFHDQPKLIHDCMQTWLTLAEVVIARHQRHVTFDVIFLAEDICYKNGPLISPAMVREFLFPYYQQLIGNVRSRQIDRSRHLYVHIDTDGYAPSVIPLYQEIGMDMMLPFEVAAGCDVVAIGAQYPGLVMSGGIDKRVLATTPAGIDAYLARVVVPMRARGGYTPTSDHGVPAEVSYSNYLHYRKRMKELGG